MACKFKVGDIIIATHNSEACGYSYTCADYNWKGRVEAVIEDLDGYHYPSRADMLVVTTSTDYFVEDINLFPVRSEWFKLVDSRYKRNLPEWF